MPHRFLVPPPPSQFLQICCIPCCDVQLKGRSQEMEEVTGMQASITKQLVAKERQLHSNSLELAGLKSGRASQVAAPPC